MNATILEQTFETNTARHRELLQDYRRLLSVKDAEAADAGELIATGRELSFPLSRLPGDALVIQEVERLGHTAAGLDDAEADHQTAHAASEKHRVSMQKKIAVLEGKQSTFDDATRSARGRAARCVDALSRSLELRHENPELFADVGDEQAEIEEQRLRGLVDELPRLRADLAESEVALAAAEVLAEEAANVCYHTNPRSEKREAVILAKDQAVAHRDVIASKITDLHEKLADAESARRLLSRE